MKRGAWAQFEAGIRWRLWGASSPPAKRLLGWAALAAIVASMAATALDAWSIWRQEQTLARQIHQLQDQIAASPSNGAAAATRAAATETTTISADTRRQLNRVIGHLNTPWPGIFHTLEQATPDHIALLRIEPEGNGLLSIEAEAMDVDKVVAYAGGLAHRGVFGEVTLRRHATNDRDPNRPARLVFQIKLRDGP